MTIETQSWSAVLVTGSSPKLIVQGEVRTHPYAFVALGERRIFGGPAGDFYLDLRIIGDQPGLDVLDWKRVHYERPLREEGCDAVVVGGTGTPVRIPVRRIAAHVYARNGHL